MALGCDEAMVVHGVGGLDEISLFGKTVVARVTGTSLTHHELSPRDFALESVKPNQLFVTDPRQSARLTIRLLNTNPRVREPKMGVTLANAAAAICVTRKGAAASMPSRADVDEFLRANA